MPFETAITAKEAVERIHRREYLLPSIQRSFVWSPEQIERLFDSVMRGYPIGSFLFWEVNRQSQSDYQFYEFIQHYHERDSADNVRANLNGDRSVTAILDGQQRLTSLYIGLKGTYSAKERRRRRSNDQAYPIRKLYLDLSKIDEDAEEGVRYRFIFMSEAELNSRADAAESYFEVGRILDYSLSDLNLYVQMSSGGNVEKLSALMPLLTLHDAVHKQGLINFYLEKDKPLDEVLHIFVRVNSGGTALSFSDLLLSTATARWRTLDAREEILRFVRDLNSVGDGFAFTKDLVLKSCLTLTENPIAFKVKSFNSQTMSQIEDSWEKIRVAIYCAVELISSFGYNRETLTSGNAVIPIAYYLYQIGAPRNFVGSETYVEDRSRIAKWLKVVLIKRIFGGQPDNVLLPLRNLIRGSKTFPYSEIIEESRKNSFAGGAKSMAFASDDIRNLLEYEYGEPYTYSVLSFLYPNLDFRQRFHQDHIFPRALFKKSNLLSAGLSDGQVDFCLSNVNSLANLQLLEGIANQEKSQTAPDEWIGTAFRSQGDRDDYRRRHLIPDLPLTLSNFSEFVRQREELISIRFCEELL